MIPAFFCHQTAIYLLYKYMALRKIYFLFFYLFCLLYITFCYFVKG